MTPKKVELAIGLWGNGQVGREKSVPCLVESFYK